VSDLPGLGFPVGAGAGIGPGSRVAGYRVDGELGHGGMAVVFRACDEHLGRTVALKVLAPALAADEGFRQRFLRESRAAAAVDDPHIIPVFEAGQSGGVLFIAMRFVSGGDVRSLLRREGALPAGRAAGIISPVAAALDAAHEAGLVHRDVKPANMLLDTRPGRPDHVYLSDFGLSKGVLSSVGLTGTGLFLGTPDYVSPEQVAGQPTGGRADQYALACAAFELLSGDAPFARDHGMAVIYAHLNEPPPALTARRPGLPAAVDVVLSKGLAKDPGHRYPTCGEFAGALRAALGIQPYDTRPDGSGRGASQDGHPATLVVTTPPPAPEVPGPGQAGNAHPAGTGGPSDHAATVTSDHARGGGPGRTVRDTERSEDAATGPDTGAQPAALASPAVTMADHLATVPVSAAYKATITRQARPVPAAAPSPRPPRPPGRTRARTRLACAITLTCILAVTVILATSSGGHVPVLSPASAFETPQNWSGEDLAMALSPGGKIFATSTPQGDIALWNITTGGSIRTFADPTHGNGDWARLAFSPNGSLLASVASDGYVHIWNVSSGTDIASYPDGEVSTVAFSPDGRTLAVSDFMGRTNLWNVASGSIIGTFTDPGSAGVDSLAFNPNGKELATGDCNGNTYLWSETGKRKIATIAGPAGEVGNTNCPGAVTAISFNQSGQQLAVGYDNGRTYIWNMTTMRESASFTDPGTDSSSHSGLEAVVFCPHSATLVTGDSSGAAYLWSVPDKDNIATLPDPGSHGIASVACAPNGTSLLTSDYDGNVYLWDLLPPEKKTV
jgi:hypothetical protein